MAEPNENLSSVPPAIRQALDGLTEAEARMHALPSVVVAARRRAATENTPEAHAALEAVVAQMRLAMDDVEAASAHLGRVAGLPEQSARPRVDPRVDPVDRRSRASLTSEQIEATGDLDDVLPRSIEALLSLVPPGWRAEEPASLFRLDDQADPEAFLSLVKGLRRESEFPVGHRFRQALQVCEDYLATDVRFDHFAGATLVSQTAQLGYALDALATVGGDWRGRLQSLWTGASSNVDATILELLVAAACARHGRKIEFITATHEKSPDLRVHDPFPMVVECKRRAALAEYELKEETRMREVFVALSTEARRRGQFGRYALTLKVEAFAIDVAEVARALLAQHLAPHPNKPTTYPWGEVAFSELPRRLPLPEVCRAYSPRVLNYAFDWNSDLPEWDGLICRFEAALGGQVDECRGAVGLVWTNLSEHAVKKRAFAPVRLFMDAMGQVPPGEFGIIYCAYVEGAREEIADRRLGNYTKRLSDFEHAGSIGLPISYLVRLYPRALGEGAPDLIESTIRLLGNQGVEELFDDFPGAIFTNSSRVS